jgi:hypothetical protein
MLTLNSPEVEAACYSDLFKDVYGFRPRGDHHCWPTVEAFDADYDRLVQELGEITVREAETAAAALAEYDARIAKYAREFNVSVETAIRWDMDAEVGTITSFQDVEHYFWLQGLSWAEVDRRTREWKDKEV